jgi:cell division protein FtsL
LPTGAVVRYRHDHYAPLLLNKEIRISISSIVTLATIAVLVLVLVLYIISIYNHWVSLRNRFQNDFAQIEVQLKRRYGLIPNLEETLPRPTWPMSATPWRR